MASLPVMYAFCVFVMASFVSEAKADASDEITFDAYQRIRSFSPPNIGVNKTVTAGRNISFVCRISDTQNTVHVEWYRKQQSKTAEVLYYNGRCELKNKTLPRLSVEQTDCEGGQFKLRLKQVDTRFEGDWFCIVIRSQDRYQSQYIGLHVQTLGTGQDNPESDSPQLIGGIAGGVLVLLLLVTTTCVLVRYRRTRNRDDGGWKSVQTESDQGSDGPPVMEDNPMYSSCDEENGAHAPRLGQECDVYTEIQKQPKTVAEFSKEDDLDGGSTYATPDKQKKLACDDQS